MAVEKAMPFPELVKNPSSGAAMFEDAMPVLKNSCETVIALNERRN